VDWSGRQLIPAEYIGKQIPAAKRNGPLSTNNKFYEKQPKGMKPFILFKVNDYYLYFL
jgi:hypothetical protein